MSLYFSQFAFWLSLFSYEVLKNCHNKIWKIFNRIKMCKLYVTILLIRRIIFIALLITFVSINPWNLICILNLLQLWYLILLIDVRSFDNKINNIIEREKLIKYSSQIFSAVWQFSTLNKIGVHKLHNFIYGYLKQFCDLLIIMSKSAVLINITDAIRTLVFTVRNRWSKYQQSGMFTNSTSFGLHWFSS